MEQAIALATEGMAGFHLSLDMDAVDPDEAPGVGTPVRGGMTYREAHLAMDTMCDSGQMLSMEIVEVNPVLDVANRTALLGVELVMSAMARKSCKRTNRWLMFLRCYNGRACARFVQRCLREELRLRAFGFLLRAYSYLIHLILSLFLIATALLATSGEQLKLTGLLPFTSDSIVRGLLILGIAGLISTLLAITGVFRYLFPIWVTIVLILTIRGFFFSSYRFQGEQAFKGALWLTFGVLGAFFGGIWVLKPRKGRL